MRATIAIAMKAKMPAHQWQKHHHVKGNNTIVMMARMSAY
jgi:hypothetical protein